MTLQLTDEDVLLSDTASKWNCPIARGLRRVLKRDDVYVGTYNFCVDGVRYENTPEMIEFIQQFDQNRGIKVYTLEIPYDNTKITC